MNNENAIRIRKAIPQDLESILRLDQALFALDMHWDKTLDPDWTRSEAGLTFFKERTQGVDESLLLVAEYSDNVESKVVGYLSGAIVEADDYRCVRRLAELECFCVDEAFRSGGVGKQLVNRFLSWSREKKAERINVRVTYANHRAIAFYERVGFVKHDLILEHPLG